MNKQKAKQDKESVSLMFRSSPQNCARVKLDMSMQMGDSTKGALNKNLLFHGPLGEERGMEKY